MRPAILDLGGWELGAEPLDDVTPMAYLEPTSVLIEKPILFLDPLNPSIPRVPAAPTLTGFLPFTWNANR